MFEVIYCLLLACIYVASLYIWKQEYGRDHRETIKRRFISAGVVVVISPLYVSIVAPSILNKNSLWTVLGLEWSGSITSAIVAVLLTSVLFCGPIVLQYMQGTLWFYWDSNYWSGCFQDWVWWRNIVVAPVSEEWTFRACMLPILLDCCSYKVSIFVAPVFFGVAHLHHAVENVKQGVPLHTALLVALFQLSYTTVFGAYSSFLYLRTGHFIAPLLAHTFCNHMGFPDFPAILKQKVKDQLFLILAFVTGLVLWCLLLFPLTDPVLFNNNVYSSGF